MSTHGTQEIDHRSLYRLPWTLSDNVLAWLEATWKCNLACEGCYRANVADSHKTLEALRHELDCFAAQRTFDSVSIAGGDPLLHPEIVELVRMIAERGYKPTLNTNGYVPLDALTGSVQFTCSSPTAPGALPAYDNGKLVCPRDTPTASSGCG